MIPMAVRQTWRHRFSTFGNASSQVLQRIDALHHFRLVCQEGRIEELPRDKLTLHRQPMANSEHLVFVVAEVRNAGGSCIPSSEHIEQRHRRDIRNQLAVIHPTHSVHQHFTRSVLQWRVGLLRVDMVAAHGSHHKLVETLFCTWGPLLLGKGFDVATVPEGVQVANNRAVFFAELTNQHQIDRRSISSVG